MLRFPGRNVLDGGPGVPVHRIAAQGIRGLAPPLGGRHDVGQPGQAVLAGNQREIRGFEFPVPDQFVIVLGRGQMHAALSHVSLGLGMIRIDSVHGRDVVDHVEDLVAEVSLHALRHKGLHLLSRLFDRSEAEDHLLHPGGQRIPIRIEPAGEGIHPGQGVQVQPLDVLLCVDGLDRDPGQVGARLERRRIPLPRPRPGLFRLPEVLFPLFSCHGSTLSAYLDFTCL